MQGITYENQHLTVFSEPCDGDVLENLRFPELTVLQAVRKDGITQKVVFTSETDGSVWLRNNFATQLMAVSDNVPVGRFGDFLQHVHSCPFGEFLEIKIARGITYTVTAIA